MMSFAGHEFGMKEIYVVIPVLKSQKMVTHGCDNSWTPVECEFFISKTAGTIS